MQYFLTRLDKKSPTIDKVVGAIQQSNLPPEEVVDTIGELLLHLFWTPEPLFTEKQPHQERDGVYFNGQNLAEFQTGIFHGKFKFWNKYKLETGIEEPEKLMKHWLKENSRERFVFNRTPEEILTQQYLGEGGGCSSYVTVMSDILRAFDIPTKIIFCLKTGEEMEKVAEGENQGVGHYMSACLINSTWVMNDPKWQWNPNHTDFYNTPGRPLAAHRSGKSSYVPVTNNGSYSQLPPTNHKIGFAHIGAHLPLQKFAQNFLTYWKNR